MQVLTYQIMRSAGEDKLDAILTELMMKYPEALWDVFDGAVSWILTIYIKL